MRAPDSFEYAVIRFVPSVPRQEFLNVGVIVYCQQQNFLQAAFELHEQRFRAFAPDMESAEITKHLRAFELICAGGAQAGAIGALPAGQRFRWLTAPRSTIIQTSPTHTGLCADIHQTLAHLLAKLVC